MKKILQCITGIDAYDEIRILEPLRHIYTKLKDENIIVSTVPLADLSLQICQGFDYTVFHGAISLACFNIARQIKYVLFADDYMHNLPRYNPARNNINEIQLKALKWLELNAHKIVTTTERLGEKLGHPEKTLIAPNVVNLEWIDNNSENILVAGGNSHAADWELLNGLRTRRKVVFFGHTIPSQFCHYRRDQYGSVIMSPNQSNIGFLPIELNYEKYQVYMKNMDYRVGLCPLIDNEFNSCKSIWKFLEYLIHGSVSVVSNVLPYKEIPDECCVKVGDNWDEAIEYAFENYKQIYKNAWCWVKDQYTYERGTWLDVYRQI